MEREENVEGGYSTNKSTESLYAVEVDMGFDNANKNEENVDRTKEPADIIGSSSTAVAANFANNQLATIFGTQFQEIVMRALLQSMASSIGPPSGQMPVAEDLCKGNPIVTTEEVCPEKTWSERTYNVVRARQKRKVEMTRTSVGEGSDSERDFIAPENETPQERSVRSRRLNRFRVKRAKDLTSNRKAMNKVPYVIRVDGMAKGKGFHKHLWRAAVRGQCGRLDPTMDNINHHPKQVVDSIWHALEKEWEFEGFAHRAREMFERSATKFMRNRKMQLKYKCQKIVDGPKPEDVKGGFWSKIVDLSKKGTTQNTSQSSMPSSSKGKEIVLANVKVEEKSLNVHQVCEKSH